MAFGLAQGAIFPRIARQFMQHKGDGLHRGHRQAQRGALQCEAGLRGARPNKGRQFPAQNGFQICPGPGFGRKQGLRTGQYGNSALHAACVTCGVFLGAQQQDGLNNSQDIPGTMIQFTDHRLSPCLGFLAGRDVARHAG